MTIRQVIPFGSAAAAASAISYKGSATATTTSVTPPTHAANDTLLMLARNSSGYPITIPEGWTEINSINTTSTMASRCAYKVAAGSSETSGTWSNAADLICAVYDGVASIGGSAEQSSGGSTAYWPAITMSVGDGTSWVVGMGAFKNAGTGNASTPPAGLTNRTTVDGDDGALHDSAGGMTAWNQQTTSVGIGALTHAYTFELVSE